MNEYVIYERIKQALSSAPRNQYTAELHLQMIKYADDLKTITAKEFCEGVGLRSSFGTEFSKMRNLVGRLKAAGMDTVERHNRTIRYSWVSKHLFDTLEEVQDYATQWLWFYNHERPHKANGGKPPLMAA